MPAHLMGTCTYCDSIECIIRLFALLETRVALVGQVIPEVLGKSSNFINNCLNNIDLSLHWGDLQLNLHLFPLLQVAKSEATQLVSHYYRHTRGGGREKRKTVFRECTIYHIITIIYYSL